ncbi:hypothetical protein M514_06106 [Trichuris suis]|uniref:Uncharacterized protein n=1 Tax=Trichuris suis TaxID=68888 RepID=A0A085NK83_9BILA|nr:hypothetical protein M513_06106 [Trichuris suis]KFD69879.1 hypothetical protein M514_06106 [Trichuris suis]
MHEYMYKRATVVPCKQHQMDSPVCAAALIMCGDSNCELLCVAFAESEPADQDSATRTQVLAEALGVHLTTMVPYLHSMGNIQKYGKMAIRSSSELAEEKQFQDVRRIAGEAKQDGYEHLLMNFLRFMHIITESYMLFKHKTLGLLLIHPIIEKLRHANGV